MQKQPTLLVDSQHAVKHLAHIVAAAAMTVAMLSHAESYRRIVFEPRSGNYGVTLEIADTLHTSIDAEHFVVHSRYYKLEIPVAEFRGWHFDTPDPTACEFTLCCIPGDVLYDMVPGDEPDTYVADCPQLDAFVIESTFSDGSAHSIGLATSLPMQSGLPERLVLDPNEIDTLSVAQPGHYLLTLDAVKATLTVEHQGHQTGVGDVVAVPTIRRDGVNIIVTGMHAGDVAELIALDGHIVSSSIADNHGQSVMHIGSILPGIYLVSVGKSTIKLTINQ